MYASDFLKSLSRISPDELTQIKGIGEVIAQNLTDFVSSKRYTALVQHFTELENAQNGLRITTNTQKKSTSGALSGQVICITGTFEIGRSDIKKQLEAKGAKVTDSITNTTTLLLAGESAGSKLEKAKKLGIAIESSLDILSR
jgi:DNA ligase (NAD+)